MSEPALYILMRTDLASMNAGKGMAQAAHASNAFVKEMDHQTNLAVLDAYDVWRKSTDQGFGTTVVLAADGEQTMRGVVNAAKGRVPAGLILDPSYPVRDGAVTHLLPIYTCAYVFVPDKDVDPIYPLNTLELHP